MQKLINFTNQYPLSKTLRFELIPQRNTLHFIEKNGLIAQDEQRAIDYKKAKNIIDEYHKYFINKALDGLTLNGLDEYYYLYKIVQKDDVQKKQFVDVQLKLRKQIAERFSKHPNEEIKLKFKNLFSKELIKDDLCSFVSNPEDALVIKSFDIFTTYFTGFHENRANMYAAEDKSTAIGYRLIHQNLPKFIDNARLFEKVTGSAVKVKFKELLIALEPYIQVANIEEMFELNYFNETLTQIGIDKYNYLLGGYTSDDGKIKIKGLNEYINLHNQTAKREDKIGKLKPLYKQILSDRNTISFLPEEFKTDAELLESIDALYQELNQFVFNETENDITSLPELLKQLNNFDLGKVYIKNDAGLTDVSQKMFGNWAVLQQAIYAEFENNYTGKLKKGTEKYEEEQSKYFKRFDSFSIKHLNESLQFLSNLNSNKNIEIYFNSLGNYNTPELPTYFEIIEQRYKAIETELKSYPESKNLIQDQLTIDKLKALLDSIKNVQHFVRCLLGKGNEPDKDEKFYGELDKIWNTLDQITPLYNKVRNYVTRKPYSTEKIKLNFENSTLLDGWDVNKEEANSSILFVKDEQFYLGIMDKKHNKIFRNIPVVNSEEHYKKVNYKLLPGASKMLPKVFFSNSNIKFFAPSDEILRIRNHGTHTKNGKPQEGFDKLDFSVTDCRKIIDFFKESINKHEEWKNFGFKFKPSLQYDSIDEFYREVENQGYTISYTNISEKYINQLVDEGKLYLFKIYNKDFSPNSKGTPNMHTLYWKMLFDESNLANVVYKLNGQAEIFYRKASIKPENTIVHKANETINNKNKLNKKPQSEFRYDIIKDRRFTVDKFQFHVPITLNFKANGIGNINTKVNEYIQQGGVKYIIGLDRGERHLLYLTVIDDDGKIVEQCSLNEIVNEYNGQTYRVNYHTLLDAKEGGRDEARKNWKTIENIKELKEGYLSQVIHKITELMLKYNAIVVLEDLNMGFMRGRQKVEKQVYQKFEKMLIDKLNYFVDKKKVASELGGPLNALQLTNQFISFQKLGKQCGFLFYVPAWNTSKMDPVTGFVNMFNTKYENIDKAITFFEQFDHIAFNANNNYFEFGFDYKNFTNKDVGEKTKWTLSTYGDRIITQRNKEKNNQWDSFEVNLTNKFIELFDNYKIDYSADGLQKAIVLKSDKTFLEALMYLFKLTLQMRNSITNSETDYLVSPVANVDGYFYDSRNAPTHLPQNADANGAYNIARKGLWVIEQIKKTQDLKKVKLAITNAEWLQFTQNVK